MLKFRLYYDKDAKTEWLNRMAADGWAMKSFFAGLFRFEECEKGEYIYQVDFGDRLNSVSRDYRELMQDMGIEIVQTWGFWVILRKKASEGTFELYTDVDSRIGHYKKIRRMFKVATIIQMVCIFVELYFGFFKGITLGYVCALLLAVILASFLNALIRLNNTIADLEGRRTGIDKKYRSRNISAFLAAGMLMNCFALLLRDSVLPTITRTMQILAIILMIVGLFRTCARRK